MERQEDEVASEIGLIGCVGFDILIKGLVTVGVLFQGTLLGGGRKAPLNLAPEERTLLTAGLKAEVPHGSHLSPARAPLPSWRSGIFWHLGRPHPHARKQVPTLRIQAGWAGQK